MTTSLNLDELLRNALSSGAIGFTLRSGLCPVIYSEKGEQTHESQASTAAEMEEILRQLVSSRELRMLRSTGVIHFTSVFADIPLLGGAKTYGEQLRIELRKTAQP
jgi:hypothetical protein